MRYPNLFILALATTNNIASAAPVPVSAKFAIKACSGGLTLVAGVCSAIALNPATSTPAKFIAGGIGLATGLAAGHGLHSDYKDEKAKETKEAKEEAKKKTLRLNAPKPAGGRTDLMAQIKNADKKHLKPVADRKKVMNDVKKFDKQRLKAPQPRPAPAAGPRQRVPHAHTPNVV